MKLRSPMLQVSGSNRRAIFLDRDGTINHSPTSGLYITSPDDLQIIDGVPEAIVRFREAGFLVIVVTNQSGIARGVLTHQQLEAIHERMIHLLAGGRAVIDDILYCPHVDADECACRKPKPGMLVQAALRYNIDLSQSIMVGDAVRDVEAGLCAGCATVLVGSLTAVDVIPTRFVRNLYELAECDLVSLTNFISSSGNPVGHVSDTK